MDFTTMEIDIPTNFTTTSRKRCRDNEEEEQQFHAAKKTRQLQARPHLSADAFPALFATTLPGAASRDFLSAASTPSPSTSSQNSPFLRPTQTFMQTPSPAALHEVEDPMMGMQMQGMDWQPPVQLQQQQQQQLQQQIQMQNQGQWQDQVETENRGTIISSLNQAARRQNVAMLAKRDIPGLSYGSYGCYLPYSS